MIIPSTVTTIADYAFYNCTGLKTVSLAYGLNTIGNNAFYGCSALTSITIPSSVETIENSALGNCVNLASITLPFIGQNKDGTGSSYFGHIFGASSYISQSNYIPNLLRTVSITGGSSIGNYAFYGCALTSITIPNSVETIGLSAFANCVYLESMTLPFIGQNKDGTGASYFGYIFGASSYSSQSNYIPNLLRTVSITGGTDIGNYAFYGCSALTSITIPNSVEAIGEYAFYNCTSLNAASLPNGLSQISNNSFYGCSALTSITIPDSVETIGEYAFYNCTELTSISLPDGLNEIGTYAFSGLTSLASPIIIPNSVQTIGDYAFNSSNLIIYVEIAESDKPAGWSSNCFSSYTLLLYDINNRVKTTYTFTTNDGSSVADITEYVLWSAPVTTREGYQFTGWYTDAACTGSPISFPYTGDANNFYAGWLEESGTSFATAKTISVGSSAIVNISSRGQSVYFKFTITSQRTVRIYAETTNSNFDNYGDLYDSGKNRLAYDDDSNGNGNFLITRTLSSGTYYVKVRAYSSTSTGECRLVLAYS